jgi:hypothetical protein
MMNSAMSQHIRQLNSSRKLNDIQKLPEDWEAVMRHKGDNIEVSNVPCVIK